MKKVLCIGSINMDLVIETKKPPVMGETVYGEYFKVVPGGKGANQAIALAKLGCNTAFIGSVGNDLYGHQLMECLTQSGIDTRGIATSQINSGIAVIIVSEGDNSIILNSGANAAVTIDSIDRNISIMEESDFVLFQFELPLPTVYYAMKKAKELGKTVILNPAPMIDFDLSLLDYTDIFIPNQYEAEILLEMSIQSPADGIIACEKLLKLGLKQVIITLGENGCVYNDGSEIKHKKAYKVKPVDSTAAGDSFIGGICRILCEEKDIHEAVDYATAVSAIVVGKKGASTSIPDENEVKKFLEIYKK